MTNPTTHIQPEWHYNEELSLPGHHLVYRKLNGRNYLIANVCGYPATEEQNKEHARLIMAAPELLEALRAVTEISEDSNNFHILEQVRAAIAKAEGK